MGDPINLIWLCGAGGLVEFQKKQKQKPEENSLTLISFLRISYKHTHINRSHEHLKQPLPIFLQKSEKLDKYLKLLTRSTNRLLPLNV